MQFLTIVLFIHIIVGCFMLTNPSLFKTESSNGVGFKMPSLPVNPGEELREVTNTPEAGPLEMDEQTQGEIIIGKISERIEYFHQQIYLLFVIMVFSGFFAGSFLKRILIMVINEIKKLLTIVVLMIKSIINSIINYIK